MSTHNPPSPPVSPYASSEHEASESNVAKTDSSRTRSYILLGVLALLLFALWYDYKVARPQVEAAYESVGRINASYNAQPGKKYLTDKEIQKTLNRAPARFFEEGPYHIEVYSYRSGLPIRSHNYYAVYSAGVPMIFLKHYKFELPMEELKEGEGGEGPAPTQTAEAQKEFEDQEREAAKQYSETRDATPGKLNPPSDVPIDGNSEPAPGELQPDEAPTPTSAKPAEGDQK